MNNLENLHRKLIAAARVSEPSDHAPYAFEKRIMARLGKTARVDLLTAWNAALWRGAVLCVGVMVLSGAWAMWSGRPSHDADFSLELETAIYANAGSSEDVW